MSVLLPLKFTAATVFALEFAMVTLCVPFRFNTEPAREPLPASV
jgi:hypothetical protein